MTTDPTWAVLEVMGHRTHVGLICEEVAFGATMIRIDVLGRDGSFATIRYSGAAIFSLSSITEERARHMVIKREWQPCDAFTEPSALAGACARCGYTSPEHEKHKALAAAAPRFCKNIDCGETLPEPAVGHPLGRQVCGRCGTEQGDEAGVFDG